MSYLKWIFDSKWNLLWTYSTLRFVDEYAPSTPQPPILFVLVNIHLKTIKVIANTTVVWKCLEHTPGLMWIYLNECVGNQ